MKKYLSLILFAACAPAVTVADQDLSTDESDTDVESDDTEAAETDTVETDVTETDPDSDADSDSDTDVVIEPPINTTGPVRFIALGDAGEGNADQYKVADAIEAVCDDIGCDFAVYLGDNFYDGGVYSVDDQQFVDKFELPYGNLDFPFYVVLGNHDFGEIPVEFWRTDYQIEYTARSSKWTMPAHHYAFEAGNAAFFALDTNQLMLGTDGGLQKRFVRSKAVAYASKTWRFAFGHHPWRSNGEHGNAGNYEGAWYDPTGLVKGTAIKKFFDDDLCGRVDFYLSGHDHNRQWLEPTARCGANMLVSGAGAKTSGFVGRDNNPTVFESYDQEGFIWFELDGTTANIRFYNSDGVLEYEGVVTK